MTGHLSSGDAICEQPLLTVGAYVSDINIRCIHLQMSLDRQMGLNIVHEEGRNAKTIFNLIRYDENTDTSVILCKPTTGRCESVRWLC